MKKQKLDKEDFVKLPQYPGGSKALKTFIDQNLIMPQRAIDSKVKDFVYLDYKLLYDGTVGIIKILKSLDENCDNEAMRVVKLLKYNMPKNRGLKVYSNYKIKIHFDYTKYERKIIYEIKSSKSSQKPSESSYFYDINI